MVGKLIFVSGLSGSGKTTLITRALEHLPDVKYLKTYTTRPKRTTETNSIEYVFVSDSEYEKLKAASKSWDHTDYVGYKYGADVDQIKADLANGTSVICSVVPNMNEIKRMAALYGQEPILIWIDTPPHVAKQRLAGDAARKARIEDDSIRQHFNVLFRPTGNLEEDASRFTQSLKSLL